MSNVTSLQSNLRKRRYVSYMFIAFLIFIGAIGLEVLQRQSMGLVHATWLTLINVMAGILFATVIVNFTLATVKAWTTPVIDDIEDELDDEVFISSQATKTLAPFNKEEALINAWRRFIDFDNASIQLKKDRIQVRSVIIILGVATSFLAVFIGFMIVPSAEETVANYSKQHIQLLNGIKGFLQIVLAILPIAVSVLIAFATDFAPSTSWAVYRVGAELIRREIFLYRFNAGPYQINDMPSDARGSETENTANTGEKLNEIFLENIRKASLLQPIHDTDNLNNPVLADASQQVLSGNGRFPHSHAIQDDADIIAIVRGKSSRPISTNWMDRVIRVYEALKFWDVDYQVQSKSSSRKHTDDGFNMLTAPEYVDVRLVPQLNWYISRIRKDYTELRRWKWRILVWSGLGSVLVAISVVGGANLEPFVAVTTAIALAMGLYLELLMYNHTYLIYSSAKQQLHNLYDEWVTVLQYLDHDQKETEIIYNNFVMRVEQALQSEREQWMLRVIQTQTALEQKLAKSEEDVSGAKSTSITDAGLASTLITLGDNSFYQLRQYARARQLYVESYTIFRRLSNRGEEFQALKKIILVMIEQAASSDAKSESAELAAKAYGYFMHNYVGKITWDNADRTLFERQIERLRNILGEEEFKRCEEEGESETLSELIPEIMTK